MNKFKKLAVAAVSVIMAGTMAFSFAACGETAGPSNNPNNPGGNNPNNPGTTKPDDPTGGYGEDKYGVLNEDKSINYDVYKNRGNVTLNVAIGYNSAQTSTSFQELGAEITLPNRETAYSTGDMKPAWAQMGEDLNITWNDIYSGKATSENLNDLIETVVAGQSKYSTTDLFTTDLSAAVSKVAAGTKILNLADYLDYMPKFRKFLNDNPVVYLSLLQDGMSTTDGSGRNILVAPYFDGNDDIERYCIVRHDWAKKLLNGDKAGAATKYSEACATTTSAKAFMGSENYTMDALTADGTKTQKVTKDYAAAKAAAADESKPLGAAYKAIAGSAYGGESGNIMDIMNAALAANAGATGAQLLNLFRAYIEVAFVNDNGAVYTAENRADVFIGYDACWDVDDLVAMLRCVKTNATVLSSSNKIGGIAPRTGEFDRTTDIVSLACQLYGVRGGTSRNEFTYIDSKGDIWDARTTPDLFEAMANMHDLFSEGLIANYTSFSSFKTSSGLVINNNKTTEEYFMVYDYSQTQTLNGFYTEDKTLSGPMVPNGYYFAPIITPVSGWDVNGNGEIDADEYFRFTESWRSTKTGGLAANGAVASNPTKLAAVLQFIDYLYSKDGQIVSTFGPMATNADGDGGFWYNEVAEEGDKEVFDYKGVTYHGTEYKGTYTPTITEKLYDSFKGKTVNGWKVGDNTKVSSAALSFTSYARMLIGSTLPVGVKDQSFENQLTSLMGQAGAKVVGIALDKGVIRGLSLEIDPENYWYTCVPTSLPVSTQDQEALDSSIQTPFKYATGERKKGGDKNFFSIMNHIVMFGTDSTYTYQGVTFTYHSIEELLETKLGNTAFVDLALAREFVFDTGWRKAKEYWEYLSTH